MKTHCTRVDRAVRGCAFVVIATVAVGLVQPRASAQTEHWTGIGPDGGISTTVLASPIQPGLVWAGGRNGGVFVSNNGGDSWNLLGDGLLSSIVLELAFSGASEGTLFAGTNDGLYLLQGDSDTWQRAQGLPADAVGQVAIDPANPLHLFVTIRNGPISGSFGLYSSTDGGNTWVAPNPGLFYDRGLAVLNEETPTLLATNFQGVHRFEDDGTFEIFTEGLPRFPIFWDVATDPHSPGVVYATISDVLDRRSLPYRSTDGGRTWQTLATDIIEPGFSGVSVITVHAGQPETVYWGDRRGVFRSDDRGDHWHATNQPPAHSLVHSLSVAPTDGAVFAGVSHQTSESQGVVRSLDAGATWEALDRGFRAVSIESMWLDPEQGNRLLVTTGDGRLMLNVDGGPDWIRSREGIGESFATMLFGDRFSPAVVYAVASSRLYRSADSGATWVAVGPRFQRPIDSLQQSATEQDILYIASDSRVWRSENGGLSWEDVSGRVCGVGNLDSFAIGPPAADGSMIAGCLEDVGLPGDPPQLQSTLLGSSDHGQSWNQVFEAPPVPVYGTWSFARGAAFPGEIFAAVSNRFNGGGLFRRDSSGSWREVEALDRTDVLGVFPSTEGELFVATADRGLLRSVDGGDDFEPFNLGFTSARVTTMAFGAGAQGRLWAGTGSGVHFRDRQSNPEDSCVPSPTVACLNQGRFRVEVDWQTSEENGPGVIVPGGTGDSTNLYFFSPNNWEMLVKVLDGCAINDHYWVFFAATTDVAFTMTVTDTETDLVEQWFNPLGQPADAVTDTSAFATCP